MRVYFAHKERISGTAWDMKYPELCLFNERDVPWACPKIGVCNSYKSLDIGVK